jgi:hypothetical protein
MVVRRYRRRRIPRRRFVRRKYHRRIYKPVGSGFSGKRFFKLKYISTITSSLIQPPGDPPPPQISNFTIQHDDNPNNAIEWVSFANMFDYYRCCAMKIKFVPSVMADTSFQYQPGYIFLT